MRVAVNTTAGAMRKREVSLFFLSAQPLARDLMISSERAASGARPYDFFLSGLRAQPLARDLIISFWAASERSLWRATLAFLFEPQSSAAPGARKMRQHYADANAVFNALGAVFKARICTMTLLLLIMRRRICTIALKPRNAPSLKSSARNRQRRKCLK